MTALRGVLPRVLAPCLPPFHFYLLLICSDVHSLGLNPGNLSFCFPRCKASVRLFPALLSCEHTAVLPNLLRSTCGMLLRHTWVRSQTWPAEHACTATATARTGFQPLASCGEHACKMSYVWQGCVNRGTLHRTSMPAWWEGVARPATWAELSWEQKARVLCRAQQSALWVGRAPGARCARQGAVGRVPRVEVQKGLDVVRRWGEASGVRRCGQRLLVMLFSN